MKNIDEWVEWMTRNPELAEKYYPEIMQGLTEQIKSSEPFLTALIIQKLPDHFPNWKTEAEKYLCIKRKKMIQGYIDLIKAVLIEYEYPSEIEQKAVESVRAELTEQLEYWNNELKALPPQPIVKRKPEQETIRYTAKHYVLAYLIECNAKGESLPIGQKKVLEKIGNERMGTGKGNRFYKVFNEVINKYLNAEENLSEIGGEYWRKAVIELSKAPELVENYLQNKQL